MKWEILIEKYRPVLLNREVLGSSYTLMKLDSLKPMLEYLKNQEIKALLDLGCGYGVITLIVGEFIGAKRVYAVDLDGNRTSFLENIKKLSPLDVTILNQDFSEPLNIPEKVQLVTSFGSLEHNANWDEIFENVKRVLVKGGYLLISMPNLGSWVNRIALLLGYQPRDLEISKRKLYGVAPPFKNHGTAGHIKIATFKAFKEFLIDNGFEIVNATPLYSTENILINLLDKLFNTPSLSRRYTILARKI